MNNTKIEWCDKTLNPVVGCTHGCSYCYAEKQAKRQKHNCNNCYTFTPHFHPERLEQLNPRQKPKRIFIDSMWDWNCSHNKKEWIFNIIDKMEECSQHTFLILSKRPKGYERWAYPPNVWLGTTITNTQDVKRGYELMSSVSHKHIKKFISVEPLHGLIDAETLFKNIDWLIVGAETGNQKNKIIPKKMWVDIIIEQAGNTPIFLKDNLKWHTKIQEIPEGKT